MNTIFMNSKNSKTNYLQRLLFNLTYKINLKTSHKYISLSNFRIYYTRKNIRFCTKIINLKYHSCHGMKSLNDLMDYFLYQMFKITLNISLKKHEEKTDNTSIRIYVNKLHLELELYLE